MRVGHHMLATHSRNCSFADTCQKRCKRLEEFPG